MVERKASPCYPFRVVRRPGTPRKSLKGYRGYRLGRGGALLGVYVRVADSVACFGNFKVDFWRDQRRRRGHLRIGVIGGTGSTGWKV